MRIPGDGLRADSTLYDLYLGLGSYHYWKSAKAGILRWILLFKDERDKGIAELKLAADSAQLFREAARSALIWAWLNEKQYDSTVAIASEFAARYPNGKSFLWPLAEAYLKSRRYIDALTIYEDLRNRLEPDPGNYYNLIEVDSRIARCYEELRRIDDAADVGKRARTYLDDIPSNTRQRQRSNLKYLKRLARL